MAHIIRRCDFGLRLNENDSKISSNGKMIVFLKEMSVFSIIKIVYNLENLPR